jgi:hypothetical protein
MSGTSYLAPITLDTVPKEGAKVWSFPIAWGATVPFGTAQINLLSAFQSGQFTTPQAVYIDNGTCPYQVRLVCQETGLTVRVPPFAQGTYTLIMGNAPVFSAFLDFAPPFFVLGGTASIITACTTRFYFLNVPRGESERRMPLAGINTGSTSRVIRFTNATNANPAASPPRLDIAFPTANLALPPLDPATGYYLISSVIMSVIQSGVYPTISNLLITMGDSNIVPGIIIGGHPEINYFARLIFDSMEQMVQPVIPLYQGEAVCTPPILSAQPGYGFTVVVAATSAPLTGGGFPDGSGYIEVAFTVNYGNVIIQ